MGRKRRGERVLGPYEHGNGFKIIFVADDGTRIHRCFATESAAQAVADDARRDLEERREVTLGDALIMYQPHLEQRGSKPESVAATLYRLRWFFGDDKAVVSDLTPAQAGKLYLEFSAGRSVDSHRNVLSEVKTLAKWMVGAKLLTSSPFADVQGIGKRRHGKPQLRRDEARRWLAKALERAEAGDDRSLAAAMALTMGMRAGEVLARVARDLDDDGTVLVIERAKTKAGNRTVPVPALLRPLLARLVDGKRPGEPLFGFKRKSLLRRVRQLCELADVPPVCTHSLRGFLSTAAIRSGVDPDLVAKYVGHESSEMTLGSYVAPGAHEDEQRRRGLRVLMGGRESVPQPFPGAKKERVSG